MNMKKLFASAAVAAMIVTGASAGVCGVESECPYAYRVKVLMKTTGAKTATDANGEKACYRKPQLVRLIGYVYGETTPELATDSRCNLSTVCGCNAWDGSKIVLWDFDTKEKVDVSSAGFQVLDVIGTEASETVEMTFDIDGIRFGGFGSIGKRGGYKTVKNASGYCAGYLPAPKCHDCRECGDVVDSSGWTLCGDDKAEGSCSAYGKWSMAWDETAYRNIKQGAGTPTPGSGWEEADPCDMTL